MREIASEVDKGFIRGQVGAVKWEIAAHDDAWGDGDVDNNKKASDLIKQGHVYGDNPTWQLGAEGR